MQLVYYKTTPNKLHVKMIETNHSRYLSSLFFFSDMSLLIPKLGLQICAFFKQVVLNRSVALVVVVSSWFAQPRGTNKFDNSCSFLRIWYKNQYVLRAGGRRRQRHKIGGTPLAVNFETVISVNEMFWSHRRRMAVQGRNWEMKN